MTEKQKEVAKIRGRKGQDSHETAILIVACFALFLAAGAFGKSAPDVTALIVVIGGLVGKTYTFGKFNAAEHESEAKVKVEQVKAGQEVSAPTGA